MKTKLSAKVYAVVARAVEEGVTYGWHRAHKHLSNPADDGAIEMILHAVMSELCEVINFD